MTAPVSNIPVSIDYTSRDYYALRDALIRRVQERTKVGNDQLWTGDDPSDFGVALIEAFAYMGDLINYYIDRIANESYLGTATQRQNVLNLASMLGYTAGGYTSATVNLTLTTTEGYKGQIGVSELTGGTARLVIPTDNTFAVDDLVNVSGLSRTEYNGTYKITSKNSGANSIEYVPASYTVTATGNGSVVTYTTSVAHTLKVSQIVTVTGFTGGSTGYNLADKTITEVTATTFKVAASGLTGSATGTGTVVYSNIALNSQLSGFVHSIGYTTVPAGTQIAAEVTNNSVVSQIIFTTLTEAQIPFVNEDGSSGTQTVLAKHGQDVATLPGNLVNPLISPDVAGELLGYSSGEPDQSLALLETEVDTSTIKIYVENGNAFDTWTGVQHLEDYSSTDKVYQIAIDSEYNIFINFGDGIGGAIPTKDARIKASYFKGSGLGGNIPAGSTLSPYDVPGATSQVKTKIMSKVSVSNSSPATGGDVPESLNSIRDNAPRSLRALTRAVTLEDFANLSLSIPRVGKANAVASLPTSVSVYIAPERSEASTDATPGIDGLGVATPDLVSLKQEVSAYLSDKVQIGTTVTLLDPVYTYVKLTIQYTKNENFSQASVEKAIKSLITSKYSYNNVNFADIITPQSIEKDLRTLDEVKNVVVTAMFRNGGSGKNTLAGLPNEIFVFISSNITLSTASSESRLDSSNGLALTGATLSPTWNRDIYVYSASTSNSSVTVTPTASSGQTITVQDKATSSGGNQVITLSTGANTIPVSVTAADGITTSTYVLTVTKT